MDFSSVSKAAVSQLAGPLNGVIHDPTTATADQLFCAILGYRLRAMKDIAGPKLNLLFHEAKQNRGEVVNYPYLQTEIPVDFATFGPRVNEGDNFSVGMDPDISDVAFHRATRLARVARELERPEDSSRLGATLPEEILLDLYAYSLIDPRHSEGSNFPMEVDQEIARRRDGRLKEQQGMLSSDDLSHPPEVLEDTESGKMSLRPNPLTSPRSRPHLLPGSQTLRTPPADAISATQGFSIPFGQSTFYTPEIAEMDKSFIAVTAHAVMKSHDVTVAFDFGNGESGPYVRFLTSEDGTITAYVISNYDVWEPNENWFQAVMTNLEWMALTLDVPGRIVYRKSWKPTTAPWHITNAVSVVLTHVFDVYRAGQPQHRYRKDDELELEDFAQKNAFTQVEYFGRDESVASDFVMSARMMAPEPLHAGTSPAIEGIFARNELQKALEIAEDHDDEVGMYTLGYLVTRLTERIGYEQTWMNEVSETIMGMPSGVMMIVEDFKGDMGGTRNVTDIAMFSERDLLQMSTSNIAASDEMVRRHPELGF